MRGAQHRQRVARQRQAARPLEDDPVEQAVVRPGVCRHWEGAGVGMEVEQDRKSTRLNSSHSQISYAVFCLKKKKNNHVISRSHRMSTICETAQHVLTTLRTAW